MGVKWIMLGVHRDWMRRKRMCQDGPQVPGIVSAQRCVYIMSPSHPASEHSVAAVGLFECQEHGDCYGSVFF